jgi:hypothetical protein
MSALVGRGFGAGGSWRAARHLEAWVCGVESGAKGEGPLPPWKSVPRGAEEPVKGRRDGLFTAHGRAAACGAA